MQQLQEIPTSIIMGFLGAGKSTALTQLLSRKPADEKWLVLVNEFGKVAVDHLLIQGDNNTLIKEVGGGCICCSANMLLKTTLVTNIRVFRPDRVIIEPTGLAHPRKIMDMLINDFNGVLDILSVATIIDPAQFSNEKYQNHQSYQDQLAVADVLICNKLDLAEKDQISQVNSWCEEQNKPIHKVSYGQIELSWLEEPHISRNISISKAHEHSYNDKLPQEFEVQHGAPNFCEGAGLGYYSFGITFAESERFDSNKITAFIDNLDQIIRVKGVIQTENGSYSINILDDAPCTLSAVKSRKNCLEFISETKVDKNIFLNEIMLTIEH